MGQSSLNLSLFFSSMFSLFIMSLPRNLSVCSSLSARTLVKLGDNQLQAGTVQQRQHAAHDSSRCFCFGGAKRNFIGFFLPLRENCQNSQKWEIYRLAHISKLGGILCPIKELSKRGISEDTILQIYVKCSSGKRETKESSLGFRFLCILKTVWMLERLEVIPICGKNTPGNQ